MANTFVEYTGNGSTTNYSFTFEYIKEAEVKVTIDGTATTAFTFANATTLSFTTAPASGAKIRIYRETDVSSLKATFFAGSAIKAEDLNDNFTQNNFAVEEVRESTWDVDTETIKSNEAWVSSDTQIATTAAMDARFQDEATETITSSETWPDNDDTIATTAAIDNRIDTAITNDIAGSDGVSITDDGDGTITVGLSASSVDFDRIKDTDIITYNEQNAGSPSPADTNIFTASAAARRFDTLVQTSAPSGSDWQVGKTWLQNDADKTLSVWDGDSWEGISSGGTFTSQAKVVYVDATNGNDANDGHRISRPKATIKAAINQINSDSTFGDGSIVIVAPGVYQEACPIQIQKRDVAIVGTALRQCVIHPTAGTETATMFEVNSGSYLKNLTFTGMKASGTRGATGSLWENATYGLPPTQGWNVAFYNNAYIYKSPYIQNCTNFSDSEIDNTNLNFYAGDTDKGRAGDLDSAPTGGGLLVDGSTPHQNSPLRSIVCDSYTHTGLDAPGIFVTNNGYVQATSSYAFFNHAHITCINGGQANLAASTSDFGRYGLIASGKSTSAIFTSTIDGAVSDGAISFNIDAPTAGTGWHGSATRPSGNQLVTVNSITYPILSAVANGSGWTVTISRPDPNNRSTNLGVNGAINDGVAVSFFLRSMIASSGHTMEYVGSGTDYRALPENGGVPVDANQKIELDDGKIWTATTDQNGKFQVGGNQTDDPFFEVDQQRGFVTIPEGSISFNLLSDLTPQLGGNLDVNGNEITSASNGDVTINPNGTGDIVLDANVGIGTSSPSDNLTIQSSGASKGLTVNYPSGASQITLTANAASQAVLAFGDSSDTDIGKISYDNSSNAFRFFTNTSEKLRIDSSGNVGIGTTSPSNMLHLNGGSPSIRLSDTGANGSAFSIIEDNNGLLKLRNDAGNSGTGSGIAFDVDASERMRIDSSGRLLVGTSSGTDTFQVEGSAGVARVIGNRTDALGPRLSLGKSRGSSAGSTTIVQSGDEIGQIMFKGADGTDVDSTGAAIIGLVDGTPGANDMPGALTFLTTSDGNNSPTERMRIDSSGNIGIAASGQQASYTDYAKAIVFGTSSETTLGLVFRTGTSGTGSIAFADNSGSGSGAQDGLIEYSQANRALAFSTAASERMRIDSSGRVGIGATPQDFNGNGDNLVISSSGDTGITIDATSSTKSSIHFADGPTGSEAYRGYIVYAHSDDSMRIATAAAEAMRIDSSGRVGIGTSSPNRVFEIQNASPIIRLTESAGTYSEISASSSILSFRADEGNGAANTRMDFRLNGSEKMRIDSSGRLLVGASSEFGTASRNSFYSLFQIKGNTSGASSDGRIALGTGATTGSNTSLGTIIFNDTDGGDRAFIRGYSASAGGSGNYPGYLSFWTNAGAANPTERLRISSNGELISVRGSFLRDVNTGELVLAGGNATNAGANIKLFGGAHASTPNILVFRRGSSESMRIDSSGNLGVGTSSPSYKLDVQDIINIRKDGSNLAKLQFNGTSTRIQYDDATGNLDFFTNSTKRATIAYSTNRLGIGTDSPFRGVHVSGSSDQYVRITSTNSANAGIEFGDSDDPGRANVIYSNSADSMLFTVNGSERLRIDSSGSLLVGRTVDYNSSPGEMGVFQGAAHGVVIYQTANANYTNLILRNTYANNGGNNVDGNMITFLDEGGSERGKISINGSSTSYITSSDYRLKENAVGLSDGITRVKQLQPKRFNFIVDADTTVDGFFAHEAQAVVPEAVTGTHNEVDDDGNAVMQGIDQSKLVPLLTAALQEAIAKIESLETKVAALEAAE